jgi:hypothetical protein
MPAFASGAGAIVTSYNLLAGCFHLSGTDGYLVTGEYIQKAIERWGEIQCICIVDVLPYPSGEDYRLSKQHVCLFNVSLMRLDK